ncbi:MAG: terminase gpA endonuclease subunit, partial [Pseudomonadota bacterium]
PLTMGVLPATGFIFAAGVDCQDDRTEVHFKAFCRNRHRYTVGYKIIPHHISTQECHETLDAYLAAEWRTELGHPVRLDVLSIDGGTYTDDVWAWAKRHPWSRVIIVKGSNAQNGPLMVPMKFERRSDGKAKRRQKRAFLLNVSSMKGQFYKWLEQLDPAERGYCHFARGLGDEFYRQIVSEVRVLTKARSGVVTAKWELVEPARRNEVLDTEMYAEAGARRKGWASMTDDQRDALAAERGQAAEEPQGDLFDSEIGMRVPDTAASSKPTKRKRLSEILAGNG